MAQDSNKSIQKYVNDVLEAHIRKDMDEEGLNDITKDNPSRASDCLKAFDVEWWGINPYRGLIVPCMLYS